MSLPNYSAWAEAIAAGYKGGKMKLSGDYLERSRGFSPENPYYQQMAYVTKKSDLIELQQQAIRWEAEQQSYQQQMADQERLRDEQREYEHPAAQLARQRQAGINPDLSGSAGASVGGSSGSAPISAPDLADAQAPDFVTPQEEANTIFNGINTVVSAFSGITGTLNACVDFAKSLASFDDMISLTHSAARSADAAANVDEATAGDKIQQSQLSTLRSRLSYIEESAPLFRGDEEDDEIIETFKNLGDLNPEASAGAYKRYRDNPNQQAAYQKALLFEKQARAANQTATFDFLVDMADDQWLAKRYNATCQKQLNLFQSHVNEFYQTLQNAEKESSVKQLGLQINDEALKHAKDQLEYDIKAWEKSCKYLATKVSEIDGKIENYKGEGSYHNQDSYLLRLNLHRAHLLQLGSNQFHQMYDIISQYDEETVYNKTSGQIDSRPSQFFEKPFRRHRDFYFRRFVEQPDSGVPAATIVGTIIGALMTRSAKGAEVGAAIGSSLSVPDSSMPSFESSVR